MQLKQLTLKNFGPHRNLQLEFRPGINCVLGANGSGKSTILDAVRHLFVNECDAPGTKSENVTHGEKSGKVSGVFTDDLREYQIYRNVGVNGQHLRGPDVDEKSVAGIDKFVAMITGANTQTLRNNVFVGQGKIDSILFQRESDRLKEFQLAFGLERAQQAVNVLGKEMGRYNVTTGLDVELEQRRKALDAARTELKGVQKTTSDLQQQLAVLEPKREQLRVEVEKRNMVVMVADYRQQLESLRGKEQQLTATCRQLTEDLQKLDQLLKQVPEQQLQEEQDQLKSVLTAHARLRDLRHQLPEGVDVQQLAGERTALQQQVEKARTKYERINGYFRAPDTRPPYPGEDADRQAAEAANAARDAATAAVDEQQLQRLRAALAEAEAAEASSSCPTCGRPYDSDSHQRTGQQLEIARTQLEDYQVSVYQPAVAELQRLTAEASAARQKLDAGVGSAMAALKQAVEHWSTENGRLSTELTAIEQRINGIQSLTDQIAEQEKILVTLPKSADVDRALQDVQQRLAAFRQQSTEQATKQAELRSTQQQLQGIQQDIQQLTEKIDRATTTTDVMSEDALRLLSDEVSAYGPLSEKLLDAQRSGRSYETEAAGLTETISYLEKKLSDEAADRKWVGICRRAQDALRPSRLPTLMMAEYAKAVNNRIAYYLQLWQAPFTLEIRPEQGFAFIANKDGHDMNAARLSGGEKVVAATSFRLAMADTFASNVGLLVLDEPSAYLDENNIQHLQDLLVRLKELTTATGRQIILVTHEPSLLGFVDHAIPLKGGLAD